MKFTFSTAEKMMLAQDFANNMTKFEKLLWRRLKRGIRGLIFEPQAVIGPYIVDFYCERVKIAVELDGKQHDPTKDAIRDRHIAKLGVKVMRFPNPKTQVDVNNIVFGVYAECRWRKGFKTPKPKTFPYVIP